MAGDFVLESNNAGSKTDEEAKMPKFQIIITCLTNDMTHDRPIVAGSLNLHKKAATKGVESTNVEIQRDEPHYNGMTAALIRKEFKRVSQTGSNGLNNTRIYIRGHGSAARQTVGGLDAEGWARILKELGMPQVGIVSVTGCRAGLDLPVTAPGSMDSFGSKFHKALKDITGVKCDVFARTEYVGVLSTGQKETTPTLEPRNWRHKAPNTKYKFSWGTGQQQVRAFVYKEDV
jgi:hypothetical protein